MECEVRMLAQEEARSKATLVRVLLLTLARLRRLRPDLKFQVGCGFVPTHPPQHHLIPPHPTLTPTLNPNPDPGLNPKTALPHTSQPCPAARRRCADARSLRVCGL